MSQVFKNTLKSFKSDITGEERDYTANNAVWLYMDSLFDMTQEKFDEEIAKGSNMAMAKFTTAVLNANHVEVTYEEVMENTDPKGVIRFYNDFFGIAFGRDNKLEKKAEEAEKARKARRSK